MNIIKQKTTMVAALLRSVPVAMTIIFILAVVLMNFLARITLVSLPWLALNAGITVSWMSFLFVDIVTRHFGAKAANMLSIVAIAVNLVVCFVCVILSRVFDRPSLDMVVGGQWSILLASTIAYIVAALTNNYTNVFIGRRFFRQNPDGRKALPVPVRRQLPVRLPGIRGLPEPAGRVTGPLDDRPVCGCLGPLRGLRTAF